MSAPPIIAPNRYRLMWLLLVVVLLLAVGSLLFLFNPMAYGFYPRCLLYQSTGLHCPGCGCLRAVHQLLHGHFFAAFRYNPLFIVALPLLTVLGLKYLSNLVNGKPLPPYLLKTSWLKWTAVVVIAFGILRNLPFPPFTYLAPP